MSKEAGNDVETCKVTFNLYVTAHVAGMTRYHVYPSNSTISSNSPKCSGSIAMGENTEYRGVITVKN
jgi:hypothetical protein